MRRLRVAEFCRYFVHQDEQTTKQKAATRTDENTVAEHDEGAMQDDCCHRNYDLQSSLVGAGEEFKCAADLRVKIASAKRRHNRDLCVARQAFLEQCGESETPSMSSGCCMGSLGIVTRSLSLERTMRRTLLNGFPNCCSAHTRKAPQVQHVRQNSRRYDYD